MTKMRADRLFHDMNDAKMPQLFEQLRLWRKFAPLIMREQWSIFWKTGRFNKHFDAMTEHRKATAEARRPLLRLMAQHGGRDLDAEDKALAKHIAEKRKTGRYRAPLVTPAPGFTDDLAEAKAVLGAARVQMLRFQIVGMLESWLSNRKNDFVQAVFSVDLDERVRHELLTVNAWNAWFKRGPVPMSDGTTVSRANHRLAHAIMRQIFHRHGKPSAKGISMVLDHRAAKIQQPETATSFDYWVKFGKLGGGAIHIPLTALQHHKNRQGQLKNAVQIAERDGELKFAFITDTTAAMKESREAYQPQCDDFALDFGLRTLFASARGDLYGQGFIEALKRHDDRIQRAMKKAQRCGIKPKQYAPYVKAVARMRGFVETFINRVINHIVRTVKPKTLVLERINFQNPALSRRMNRLLQGCGRAVLREKLQDIEDWYGITAVEVNPAYTSQTCRCGYVDKKNRNGEKFTCRFCGRTVHADVNGACQISRRRSPEWAHIFTKAAALKKTTEDFCLRWPIERYAGKGAPGDPRLANPYFKAWRQPIQQSCRTSGCRSRTATSHRWDL